MKAQCGLHVLLLCVFSLAKQLPAELLRGWHHGHLVQDLQDLALGGLDWAERCRSHNLGHHPLRVSALSGTVVTVALVVPMLVFWMAE